MAVAGRILLLVLLLNEKYVLSSAVELPLATAGPLLTDLLSLID